jgi:hypothetical protein
MLGGVVRLVVWGGREAAMQRLLSFSDHWRTYAACVPPVID